MESKVYLLTIFCHCKAIDYYEYLRTVRDKNSDIIERFESVFHGANYWFEEHLHILVQFKAPVSVEEITFRFDVQKESIQSVKSFDSTLECLK